MVSEYPSIGAPRPASLRVCRRLLGPLPSLPPPPADGARPAMAAPLSRALGRAGGLVRAAASASAAEASGPAAGGAVLLYAAWGATTADAWAARLRSEAPGLDLRTPPDAFGDLRDVTHAIVWAPPHGLLRDCPNLRCIQSLGAGVDHIFADATLPPGVPVCRIVDPLMSQRMATYVTAGALNFARRTEEYWKLQQAGPHWDQGVVERERDVGDVTVGVLGSGNMGATAAEMLRAVGFRVRMWSRTGRRRVDGVESFAGAEGLDAFLGGTEILVNLLPLTPETEGLVDAGLLAKLPAGASFINGARGAHVVDADLVAALDAGRLDRALLDVFTQEPLPEDSPYWRHPRVSITPHSAAVTNIDTTMEQIMANLAAARAGAPLINVVDTRHGY